MTTENARIKLLRERLWQGLSSIKGVRLNGDAVQRVAHNVNVSFSVSGSDLMDAIIADVAVSSGSACNSASLAPSYVLRAIGCSDAMARSSIRFSLGRFTTEAEVDYAVQLLQDKVGK